MDIGVYFEIDSFLPIRPVYEFMRSSSYKKTDIMGEGFKLRTMRFRGQISQGLLLPLSQFPEIPADAAVGDDVTELLGVRKWEIEERATTGGTVIGNLPYDIPHTDETRVQEEPELIQAFAGLEYYIYETGSTLVTSLLPGQNMDADIAVSRDCDTQLLAAMNNYIYSISEDELAGYLSTGNLHPDSSSVLLFARRYPVQAMMAVTAVTALVAAIVVCLLLRASRQRAKMQAVHNRQLSQALQIARDANEAKTTFLSNMSHDIRTT